MTEVSRPNSLSRTRSGLKHDIGDNDVSTTAPSPQDLTVQSSPSVQPLTPQLMEGLRSVHNEGFGSKVCCLCCPVTDNEGRIQKFYQKHPERLPMCGVVVGNDGTSLGFVQMAVYPMNDKDGLHDTKPGEAYIEQISVAAAARGKGVGTLLLNWAEALAREHSCTNLTLAVLNGNPARRLYERFGFRVKSTDPFEACIGNFVTLCLVGRPYGLCDPHYGVVDMEKRLA